MAGRPIAYAPALHRFASHSGSRARAGPFPIRIARAGDLGPNEDSPLAGTWQVAFLERSSRALPDPELLPRRVR